MRTLSTRFVAFACFTTLLLHSVCAQSVSAPPPKVEAKGGLRLPEIRLHDPFIHAEVSNQTYYLYSSASSNLTGEGRPGTLYYTSKDLLEWEGPHVAFVVPEDSWASPQERPWAPEVHAYEGKYYLFTTLHNPAKKLPTPRADRPNMMRSTIIAESDSPEGPFTLIKKDAPIAPAEFMTLDGTLFVDQSGKPWMVYAHEWIQIADGTIEALPLANDLSEAAGDPIHLLKGSDAPWLNRQATPSAKEAIYVTDGPQLFRTKTNHLLMLWCSYEKNSFNRDGYVQTIARSNSGTLQGPWEQLEPLVGNDSGHGMLFNTFEGQLMLIVHQPFVNARGKLYEIEDRGNHLKIARYREDLSGPPLGPQQGQTPR